MPELQAAALLVLLPRLEVANRGRRQAARWYAGALANTALALPTSGPECANVYHLYVVRSRRRDQLQEWLGARGIGTGVHYPRVIPDQPAYATPNGPDVPLARAAAAEILSLPMHPALSEADIAEVARAVREFDELSLLDSAGGEAAG
jgi:dTDP-4-amino-4,6-dideoxygalactose transaminase